MVSQSQAKTLGGVGSILMLLSIVPYTGFMLGFAGFVLVLVAVKYISEVTADRSIFNNMLISVILAIVGLVAGFAIAFATLFPVFRELRPPFDPSMFMHPRMYGFMAALIFALIVIWIFFIVSAIYLRKSYNAIESKLKVGMFGTAATLYLIGAVLTIILVGFVLIFVAEIMQTVAFFSIPDEMPKVAEV